MLAATLAVAIALTFGDPSLIAQTTFARFHTLLIAGVALAIFIYQRMMAWRGRVPVRLLVANFGIHACIVMTHYFGPLYSGAVLGAVLLTAAVRRFNPVRTAASIVLGWTVFLVWIPAYLRHRDMAKPTFWITVPDATGLRLYYEHYIIGDFWHMVVTGLGLFALAGGLLAWAGGCGLPKIFFRIFSIRRRELSLFMLVPVIGGIPLIAYFVSTRPNGASFSWTVTCMLARSAGPFCARTSATGLCSPAHWAGTFA